MIDCNGQGISNVYLGLETVVRKKKVIRNSSENKIMARCVAMWSQFPSADVVKEVNSTKTMIDCGNYEREGG